MLRKEDTFNMGSSSVDQYFEEILMGPFEVVKDLVIVCLIYISANCIHQTFHNLICLDSLLFMVYNIE